MLDRTELESFKRRIDLRQYAAAQGYQKDPGESWAGTDVMRNNATGDKIYVKFGSKRAPDHWGYYSYKQDGDHGSIVDFVMKRRKLGWSELFKELRPWIGKPPVPVPSFPPPQKIIRHREDMEAAYGRTEVTLSHAYLENERALPASLLESERFAGRIRIDARGNAIFPHFDADGLCGFEIKNDGFTGFSPGGTKGLWLSQQLAEDRKIAFCESAIDALSYAFLFPEPLTRYASIGGKLNPAQPELIRAAIARMPADSEIIAAMDADDAGSLLAERVREALGLTGRQDLRFVLHEPFGFKDWNDQLRGKQPEFSPAAPKSGLEMR